MFDLILLSIAAVLQLVLTWYTVNISIRENRVRNAKVIGILGLVAVGLTGWAGFDAYQSQEKLNEDIANIKEQLSGATIGLATIQIQPDPQVLDPDKDFLVGLAFGVHGGTAKNATFFFDAFTLPGGESDEQNRLAKSRFNQKIAAEDPKAGEDRLPETYSFKGLPIRMNEKEIEESIAVGNTAKRILYVMGYAHWNNAGGADFHTDVCKWMEPPKTTLVRNPGWHDCN